MSHSQLTSKGVGYCTCKIRQPYSFLKTTWPARCTEWEACWYWLDVKCLPQTLRLQPLGPADYMGRLQWLAGSLEKGLRAFWLIWYLLPLLYTHMFLPHSTPLLTMPSPQGLVVTLKTWAPDKSFPEYPCQVFCHSYEKSNKCRWTKWLRLSSMPTVKHSHWAGPSMPWRGNLGKLQILK